MIGSYQAEQLLKKASELKEKEPVIAKPAAAEVRTIKIASPAGKVALARAGAADAWRLTQPFAADADPGAVKAIFAEIDKMNVPDATQGGKEKHAEYQLDQRGTRVELAGAGGKVLTAFVIGKEDKGQTYVRKAGDDKVYKTYGLARALFEKPADKWRSKVLLSFAEGDLTAIEVTKGASSRAAPLTPRSSRSTRRTCRTSGRPTSPRPAPNPTRPASPPRGSRSPSR